MQIAWAIRAWTSATKQTHSAFICNDPKKWPTGCAKNALLIEDATGKYDSKVSPSCSTKGYRLPTFRESALAAASTIQRKGLRAYSETAEYRTELNKRLKEILTRIGKSTE